MTWTITGRAEDDIADVVTFGLEHFGASQARAYLAELYGAFDWIASSPLTGQVRLRFDRRTVLTRHFRAHIIIYSLRDDGHVTIERVQSSRADWTRLLD